MSRVSVSAPAYFRGFLRRYAEMPYADRIKPFGFLLSVQVARLAHPEGRDPKAFHLLAPSSKRPSEWASPFWTDAYSGHQFGITTGPSYVPGVVTVKSIATVKAEFLAHGEVKSATADGEPAGASARGLLQRRHVTASEIRLIGKESNSLEMVEAGLFSDWSAILASYGSGDARRSCDLAALASAASIASAQNVSVRTVRRWRRRQRGAL